MRFVVVVDTQYDFMAPDGALSVAGAASLIGPMQSWLAALDPRDTAGVLFTFDTHHQATYAATGEAELFPIHCVRDTPGWHNVLDAEAISPAIPCFRLEKGVFDMWAEPDVMIEPMAGGEAVPRERFFAELRAAGVSEIIVIGVAADYCVRWAIEGLRARNFRCVVPASLTRGIDRAIDIVARDDFGGDDRVAVIA
jgi:nicotinamidase/pyrazinamidase